jgi:hypothetical protein
MENGWTDQAKLLDCMRKTLEEREVFISSLIADIVTLEWENGKLKDLVGLLTTRKVNHADY